LAPTLSHIDLVHTLMSYFFNICFSVMLPSTYEHGIRSPATQLQTARRLPQPELDDERSRAKYSIAIGTCDVVDVISYVETEPCAEEISSDTSMFPTTY
jgi:hypothetical protein